MAPIVPPKAFVPRNLLIDVEALELAREVLAQLSEASVGQGKLRDAIAEVRTVLADQIDVLPWPR